MRSLQTVKSFDRSLHGSKGVHDACWATLPWTRDESKEQTRRGLSRKPVRLMKQGILSDGAFS